MKLLYKIAATVLAGALLTGCNHSEKQEPAYWLGADISSANGMEARGDRLMDFEGEETYELTELMHKLGLNAVRYRVWVDPNPENGKAIALYRRQGFREKEYPSYLYSGDEAQRSIYMELRKA